MKYSIRTTNTFERSMRRLREDARYRVWERIVEIQSNPYAYKELGGQLKGLRVARVGDYRITYAIDERQKRVIMVAIRPRERAYQ